METIEYVCSGGQGRSEPSRIILTNFIEDADIVNLEVLSSGTQVELAERIRQGGHIPEQYVPFLLEKAVKRGMIMANLADLLRQDPNSQIMQQYSRDAFMTFDEEERTNRTAALKRFGLRGEYKKPVQTRCDPTRHLVIGMTPDHVSYAQSIYPRGFDRIHTIEEYARVPSNGHVIDTFAGTQEDYFRMFERLIELNQKVFNRLITRV